MINQFTYYTLGKLSLGEFSPRKEKFGRLEQTKPAKIKGLGSVHDQICLEITHVSLFAGYTGNLEAATNTNIFHGYDLWDVS